MTETKSGTGLLLVIIYSYDFKYWIQELHILKHFHYLKFFSNSSIILPAACGRVCVCVCVCNEL